MIDLTQLKALDAAATDAPWEPQVVQNARGVRWPSFQIPGPCDQVYSAEHIDSELLCYLRNNAEEIVARLEAADRMAVALEGISRMVPCIEGGSCFHPMHGPDGEYLGESYVDPISVFIGMSETATEAIAAYRKEAAK